MRTFTALLIIVLMAACRSGSEESASTPDVGPDSTPPASDPALVPATFYVVLSVEPDQTSAGGTVELVLRNDSDSDIGYNLCTSGLDRQDPGGWQPVPSDRVCTMELRGLGPGQEARYPLELPVDLAAGTYRATTGAERMETGDREGVASNAFEVR